MMNPMDNGQMMLTEKDCMDDLLTQEKYMITSYGSFIPEAECPQLRQILSENFEGCVKDQQNIFDQMSQLGWYQTKDAPVPEVETVKQTFQQLKSQIG